MEIFSDNTFYMVRKSYWATLSDDVSNTFAGSLIIILIQDISRKLLLTVYEYRTDLQLNQKDQFF